ncbi:MAG: undecaprenyl/decaprenyl-phosphate alpha-N-acetylglucosaminyl 1-phosphate transferase [Anaerolineales bacterium]|nr:undecaprenyl/decaprenyl-phosphate alpha-N-acetylglucosaminyl 1-phosphate transferase [Anaerolineales bacterium]
MTFLTFRIIFLAGTISLLISPLLIKWMTRAGIVDKPGSAPHKQHQGAVPIAGGGVIFLTTLTVLLTQESLHEATIWQIMWPSLVVFAFGLWDDMKGASARFKLVGQLLGTIILIVLGIQVQLFDPRLNWLNIGLTIFWVVGITNAFNFVDSMDGLASGLAGLAAAFFMLATYDSGQPTLSLFSAVLVGVCLGAYFFNATPAHYFLGDSGAQWLGFSLASLAIAYNPEGFLRTQSWYLPILLVGVPIFDTTLVVFSRLRRGKPIYRANMDHTFHRLVAFGMSRNRAVLFMHVVALLLGCLAFMALELPPVWANSAFGMCLLAGVGGILWFDNRTRWK